MPPPLTFGPCLFRIHTPVLPGGGRGSDSSPDASMSEEKYWSLTGEGGDESESPSLNTCVSSAPRLARAGGAGLLGPGCDVIDPPTCLDRFD